MAPSRISTVFFLLLTTAILTTAIPSPEYNSLLSDLRSRNHDFFADAISTTEIHSDILSGRNFTVFVPIDSSPFPSDYINTVRFHIVPNYRLTASDLRKLPEGATPFPTLVPRRKIYLINNRVGLPVSYNGVWITVPDLYHDKNVVVHGIERTAVFHHFPDRSTFRYQAATDVDLEPPAWESDNSSRIVVTPAEARKLARYLAVAGFEERYRSELVADKLRGSEYAQRHLGESNIKDVSSSETRGDDAENVFDEFGTGTSELNIKEIHDVSRSETRGDDVFDEFGTGTSELISENHEGFSLMGDNKMIDSATEVEDGEQYSRIDEIRLGDPHRPELCTPASMACAI